MKKQTLLRLGFLGCLVWTLCVSCGSAAEDHPRGLRVRKVQRPRAVSQVNGKREEMQRDEAAGNTGPTRRMFSRNRGLQGMVGNPTQMDNGVPGARAALSRMPSSAGSPNLLATFAGKNRLLVISTPHESEGYYRLMMSLLKPDVYCELAERHVHQIMMFHQEGEMGGRVRRISNVGKVVEEPLDVSLIPRLMNFLKLEKGKFGMVLLKKTLQVEERYPYPVRLEAMYEVIDQSPMRKMEKVRQKGFVQKCKDAGEEGQVVEAGPSSGTRIDQPVFKRFQRTTTPKPLPTTTTTTTTTTTQPPTTTTTTTTRPTTTPRITTTSTRATTIAPRTAKPPTTAKMPNSKTPTRNNNFNKERNHPKKHTVQPTVPSSSHTKAFTGKYGDNHTNRKDSNRVGVQQAQNKPSKSKPPKKKSEDDPLIQIYDDKHVTDKPTDTFPAEAEDIPNTRGTVKQEKPEKKKKKEKVDKPSKKDKSDRKKKDEKKSGKKEKKEQKPTKNPPAPTKGALEVFLEYFENRRRLILITTPTEEHKMYTQQRDEYLEHVCEMAVRKVSIITIFGSLTNSTMKIDHYQLENDKPMKGLREDDLVNQNLITDLRKEFRMHYNDFFMVLTDVDMKWKQVYEVPIAMKFVFGYIDTFSSRIREMEQQKRDGVTCKKEDKPRSLENFLSRFRWRRRLFVISAPNDEDWAYQQQLHGLSSQACNLGLRHISVLKLLGAELIDMGGVLELYPINGSATVDREGLSATLVKDIRNYFQISPEYFSMLLVGKDGNVKSWYPSPMWSMEIIYDLIDSMQLRRQEMAIQQSLGMHCPETEYGTYGYHHGYHDGYDEGYRY